MSRWPDAAARAALRGYRAAPPGDRVHVAVRWFSCPFPPVVEALPSQGRVLEVGCGHGLFSAYLAQRRTGLHVHGVDIDEEKIAVAAKSEFPAGGRLDFAVADSGSVPSGPWDAVVLVDVLYLLDEAAQRALLKSCASVLAPGGVLVIKDMATRPRWKARWNAAQEALSVRVLKITEGSPEFGFVDPDERARWLVSAGLQRVRARRLDRGRVHPHHLLVGEAPR
ncbi:class I SAM-dependent methyltransferase [Blastococcus sp. CT_GayMR20]|uniref:class I SAM-dependent methyltransferase n=1 Tax=Blastococcus sp. CT_GayMR20 TaxID=2559609 RepID=UPI00107441B5|nr:class I SAM-dependent methyltransferase [Blastococcus sp. CT_GayMR20]TFV92798.1 class I SAM-dependent methyltransferase [Blastococcus sp. CT_GayMR20]TFV92865.1 class I SAM-dependent methyltransferase [Blastococcus sp. CT_GayMR20]